MTLEQQTNLLLSVCDESEQRFFTMRETEHTPDFFEEVKPTADYVHSVLTEWSKEIERWIASERPKYVHMVQIHSLIESMSQFVVQSFYKETGKKRFLLSINAARYTLNMILRSLPEQKEGDSL